MKLVLTPGQAADVTQAETLIEGVPFEVVIADRGYNSQAVVDAVEAKGGEAVIPTQKNRKVQRDIDRERYRDRNLVERLGPDEALPAGGHALREDRPKLPGDHSCGLHHAPVAVTPATCLAPSLSTRPSLESLSLAGTKVTDAGLVRLAGLTGLEELSLQETKVTDAGLAHLKGLTRLGCLNLAGTKVKGEGLRYIAGLTALVELDLSGTTVGDGDLVDDAGSYEG